ncbi:MAG: GNAT family N-acetyltransferase [Lachnospiraceae bacterium]
MELRYWLEEEKDYIYLSDDVTLLREQIAKGDAVIRLTKQGQTTSFLEDIQYILELTPAHWQQLNEAPSKDDLLFFRKAYCHQKGIPLVIAIAENIVIREFMMDDLPSLLQLFDEAEARGGRMPALERFYSSKEEAGIVLETYIRNHYGFREDGLFAVELRNNRNKQHEEVKSIKEEQSSATEMNNSSRMIGIVGAIATEKAYELNYALLESYQGQGFGYEMCLAMMQYIKDNFQEDAQFVAHIQRDNDRSIRLAKKLGIKYC